jgi:WD40 repeat protein
MVGVAKATHWGQRASFALSAIALASSALIGCPAGSEGDPTDVSLPRPDSRHATPSRAHQPLDDRSKDLAASPAELKRAVRAHAEAVGNVDAGPTAAAAERTPKLTVARSERGLTSLACNPKDDRFFVAYGLEDAVVVDAEQHQVTRLSLVPKEGLDGGWPGRMADAMWAPSGSTVVIAWLLLRPAPAPPSPFGRTPPAAASSSDESPKLRVAEYDGTTGKLQRKLVPTRPSSRTNDWLQFENHGLRLGSRLRTLVQRQDRELTMWDYPAGVIRTSVSFAFPRGSVTDIAVSPDGKLVAASGMTGIHVFEAASGKLRAILKDEPAGGPRTLLWLAGGRKLISSWAARWRTTVEIWSLDTGTLSHTFRLDGKHEVLAASVHTQLIALSDGTVRDTRGRVRRRTLDDAAFSQQQRAGEVDACFLGTARFVVFSTSRKGLSLLDVETGRSLRLSRLDDDLVAYTDDGKIDATPDQLERLQLYWGSERAKTPNPRPDLMRAFFAGEAL